MAFFRLKPSCGRFVSTGSRFVSTGSRFVSTGKPGSWGPEMAFFPNKPLLIGVSVGIYREMCAAPLFPSFLQIYRAGATEAPARDFGGPPRRVQIFSPPQTEGLLWAGINPDALLRRLIDDEPIIARRGGMGE